MRTSLLPLLLTVLLTVLLLDTAYSQDQSIPEQLAPSHNISGEMQVVALPRAEALPLVRELLDPAKTEQAYEKIQQRLIAGTANLIGWPTLLTRSGQRTVVEGVDEFRYATEFTSGGGVAFYLTADGRDFFIKQDAKIKGVQLDAVPATFETRNLGVTLEIEAVLAPDGQMIDVNVAARNTWLKEMRLVAIERDTEKITVEQPVFGTNNVTTSLLLKSGQRILLGSFANSEVADQMELFLLKVEVKKQ